MQQKSDLNFVPTMGGLHKGHCQLIKAAQKFSTTKPGVVLVSVFVNPLQFGPNEDFQAYPRDLEHDCEVASNCGANALWAPSIDEIFPKGPNAHFKVQVPPTLQAHLCGGKRAGHFDGVATVVLRLLNLTKPQVLFLGEKDWQQFIILRHLLKDLDLPVKVLGVATVRDFDGLAMSSRNQYLSQDQRKKALALPRQLASAANGIKKGEIPNLEKIKSYLMQSGLEVEYLEKVDPFHLQPTETNQPLSLLAASVRCGRTRLIDHAFLMTRKPIVAIDGPAGAGKSTVTKNFARRLGLLYLDTGAMYRAVTWLIKKEGVNLQEPSELFKALNSLKLEFLPSKNLEQEVTINGYNVTEAIRSPDVTAAVSLVAAQPPVRKALTEQQKAMGIDGGLVAEGRDIGTAVFPGAELKIFLTASPAERARRRANDLRERGFRVPSLTTLEEQIKERDQIDSTRQIAPLTRADDASEIVTDGMDIEEVVQLLVELFRNRIPEEVWPTPSN